MKFLKILSTLKLFFLLIILFLISFLHCSKSNTNKISPMSNKGVLDLSDWNFSKDGVIKLDGEWSFFWNQFIQKEPESKNLTKFVSVPSLWNDTVDGIDSTKAFGFASYQLLVTVEADSKEKLYLHLQDFGTSGIIYVNGEKILQAGISSKTKEQTIPQFLPAYAEIKPKDGKLEIIAEVANFSHHKGGLWESIRIGNEQDIKLYSSSRAYTDIFLTGSIIIMGLYHFGLFSLRRKDKSSLYFGMFCFLILFRILMTGERLLIQFIPNLNWEIGNKIEYLSMYLTVPFFVLFLSSIFPEENKKIFVKFSVLVTFAYSFLVIILPSYLFTRTLLSYEIVFLGLAITIMINLGFAIFHKREGAKASFIGIFFLILATVNDILHSQMIVNTGYYIPTGIFVFIFFQSYMLSVKFSKAFLNVEKLSSDLQTTNSAYSKFVPMEFLRYLNKNSILDISLGDQVQKEMTVLFVDIRSFTKLSSMMSPKDNFNFLNSYLKVVGPVIRQNQGFIDKFIGDAVMALFPDSIENSIDAAISIRIELAKMNQKRVSKGYGAIEVGIGIHTGSLMLGIIGENQRLEGTVISDAVNLASRIEGLSAEFGAPIIVTETVIQRLKNKNAYKYRFIGGAKVKGKSEEVKVFEILGGEGSEVLEKKIKTVAIFEEAISYYHEKKIKSFFSAIEKVLAENPEDKTAKYYFDNAKNLSERRKISQSGA